MNSTPEGFLSHLFKKYSAQMVFKTAVMCVFDGHRLLFFTNLRPMLRSHRNNGSSRRSCFIKKVVFKNFAIFTGEQWYWSLFLIDSNRSVFLWILQNFWEQLLWKTSANGCFWNESTNSRVNQWFLCCRNIILKRLKKKHFYSQPRQLQVALQSTLLFRY